MLTVIQAKSLSEHHFLLCFPPDRTAWWEDGSGYADGRGRLVHAHHSDVTGEDWQEVPEDSRDVQIIQTGDWVFHEVKEEGAQHLKVVVFADPNPQPHLREKNHVLLIYSVDWLDDGEACEQGIDIILGQQGFNGTNCMPKLVV